MPRDDEDDKPLIDSEAQEKLGLQWLFDLHKKMEAIRALRLRLVNESEDLTEDEAMDMVLNSEARLRVLMTTEIEPVAENRGEWDNLSLSIERRLVEDGCETLDPDDPEFFSLYGQYVDIVLGQVEKALELFGLKVTPLPTAPDVVGIAWANTMEEARLRAMNEIRQKRKRLKSDKPPEAKNE